MLLSFSIAGRRYSFDSEQAIDISIPLDFHGEQPNAFGLPEARSVAVDVEGFVGDARRGGSCNCETVTLNPHGNGTHTECVGHISNQRISVASLLHHGPIPAALVTVEPEPAWKLYEEIDAGELFAESTDVVISARAMRRAVEMLGDVPGEFLAALVVRTLPNDREKRERRYAGGFAAPYPSRMAMSYLRELGVQHLLLDLPSADRADDGGALASHRIFWGVPEGVKEIAEPWPQGTITEMIYVDDAVKDGLYMLDLQLPSFMLDAAPSRPLLFRIQSEA